MNEAEGLLADESHASFDHIHVEAGQLSKEPAFDVLVYTAFALIGASYLWPWNCLLSAAPYFYSRLDDYTHLKVNVSSCIMFINTFGAIFFSGYLASKQKNVDYKKRVVLGEMIIGIVFLLLAFLCLVPLGPVLYFICLQGCVFMSSLGAALAQTGSFSLVSKRESKYTQAIMVGQAVSGVLPAFLSMLSGGQSSQDGEPSVLLSGLYFLSATAVVGVTLSMFLFMLRRERRNGLKVVQDGADDVTGGSDGEASNEVPLQVLFKKLFIPGLSVALTFTVTLIYPIFANSVKSSRGTAFEVFVPLAIFVWNLGDLSGRLLCGVQRLVVVRRLPMIVYAVLRLLYIPLFVWSNTHIISNDVIYLLLQYTFGVTNGHLASSAMMSPRHYVHESELAAAGGFMTVALTGGLTLGSLISFAAVAWVV